MSQRGIVVVGSTNIDLIAYADRLPEDGETVLGREFRQGFGGKGANQAVMAARLLMDVAIVNAVGDDGYGTATIANFEAEGISTAYVVRVPGSSGVAPIWVDGRGGNRIIVVPGANQKVPTELAEQAVVERRPAVVVGQFEIPQEVTAAGFRAARSIGSTTILNPAPGAPIAQDLLDVTDWLVPNETEFALIAGERLPADPEMEVGQVMAFAERLGIAIVVTLGERGALITRPGGVPARVPAPSVTAVDTTGAGDAFVGAFAVGLARGADPVAAARLGCAAAADSVTRPGTQTSFADRDRASEFLRLLDG